MMPQQSQQQPPPPPPPQHPPPQQPGGGDFYRGPLQPPMRQLSAASSTNIPPDYAAHPGAPQHQQQQQQPFDAYGDNFGAKRMRKPVQRRTVDYTSSLVRYAQNRMWQRDARDRFTLQPTAAAVVDMLPSVAYPDNPSTSFASKFVHSSINKNRCSINCVVVVWLLACCMFQASILFLASRQRKK